MSENDPRPIEPQLQGQVPAVATGSKRRHRHAITSGAPWVDDQRKQGRIQLHGLPALPATALVGRARLRADRRSHRGRNAVPARVLIKYEAFVTIRVRRNPDEILRDTYRQDSPPARFRN